MTVAWAIDAYASHMALERASPAVSADAKTRKGEEDRYKNALTTSPKEGAWQFWVIREVSNAGKHALRSSTKLDVTGSSALSAQSIEGWHWFFEGPRAPYGSDRIVVELDLTRDPESKIWLDTDLEPFPGPLTTWVPVFELIRPSLSLIGGGPLQPSAWFELSVCGERSFYGVGKVLSRASRWKATCPPRCLMAWVGPKPGTIGLRTRRTC